MAGKSNKGKAKGKSKPEAAPNAATVASKDVQPLKSATGLPELGLKSNPKPPAEPSAEQPIVEAPKEQNAETPAETLVEESPLSVPGKSEGSDVSTGSSNEEKASKSPDMESRDGNGDGDADGDGIILLWVPLS